MLNVAHFLIARQPQKAATMNQVDVNYDKLALLDVRQCEATSENLVASRVYFPFFVCKSVRVWMCFLESLAEGTVVLAGIQRKGS